MTSPSNQILVSDLYVVRMLIIPLKETTLKMLILEIYRCDIKTKRGKMSSKNINTGQFFTSMMLKKKIKNGNRKILHRSHCQKNSCWEGSFKGGPL